MRPRTEPRRSPPSVARAGNASALRVAVRESPGAAVRGAIWSNLSNVRFQTSGQVGSADLLKSWGDVSKWTKPIWLDRNSSDGWQRTSTNFNEGDLIRILALALTGVLAVCVADPAFAYANPDRGPYPQPCNGGSCYRSGSQKIQHQKHHIKKSERADAHMAVADRLGRRAAG
jgi:hypothetical protein